MDYSELDHRQCSHSNGPKDPPNGLIPVMLPDLYTSAPPSVCLTFLAIIE